MYNKLWADRFGYMDAKCWFVGFFFFGPIRTESEKKNVTLLLQLVTLSVYVGYICYATLKQEFWRPIKTKVESPVFFSGASHSPPPSLPLSLLVIDLEDVKPPLFFSHH